MEGKKCNEKICHLKSILVRFREAVPVCAHHLSSLTLLRFYSKRFISLPRLSFSAEQAIKIFYYNVTFV